MTDIARGFERPMLVELAGEIDIANADAIGDRLCHAIELTRGGLLVDFTAVTFIDSSGIAMMVRVHEAAIAHEGTVTWRGIQPFPAEAIAMIGLDGLLAVESATVESCESPSTNTGGSSTVSPVDVVERPVARGVHQWWVASEAASPVPSASIDRATELTVRQSTRFTPMGRRHAVRDDSSETACGRSITRLHLFPAMPWNDSPLASRSCPACLAELENGVET
jgi:anti-anti-sigma factor